MSQRFKWALLMGSFHSSLTASITQSLSVQAIPQIKTVFKKFKNGEQMVQVIEDIASENILILSACPPSRPEALIELFMFIGLAQNKGAHQIKVLLPYLPYSRQMDAQFLGARWFLNTLKMLGVHEVITVDLHSTKLLEHSPISLKHWSAQCLFQNFFENAFDTQFAFQKKSPSLVVSPDQGGAKRAQDFAQKMKLPCLVLEKKRSSHGSVESVQGLPDLQEKVVGQHVLIVDDQIDTGETLLMAKNWLVKAGAKKVTAAVTHGLFSGQALEQLKKSELPIVLTNSLPFQNQEGLEIIDIGLWMAQSIVEEVF